MTIAILLSPTPLQILQKSSEQIWSILSDVRARVDSVGFTRSRRTSVVSGSPGSPTSPKVPPRRRQRATSVFSAPGSPKRNPGAHTPTQNGASAPKVPPRRIRRSMTVPDRNSVSPRFEPPPPPYDDSDGARLSAPPTPATPLTPESQPPPPFEEGVDEQESSRADDTPDSLSPGERNADTAAAVATTPVAETPPPSFESTLTPPVSPGERVPPPPRRGILSTQSSIVGLKNEMIPQKLRSLLPDAKVSPISCIFSEIL